MGARLARDSTAHNAARPAARTGPGSCMASGRRAHRRDRTDSRIRHWGVYATKSRCAGDCGLDHSSRQIRPCAHYKWRTAKTAQATHGHQFLDLRDIARPEKGYLAIEKTKLVGWTKGLRKGLNL